MDAHAHRISLESARALVVAHAVVTAAERVAVEGAAGRVLAEPARARFASPHYRASAMDGIAVRAADTAAADSGSPLTLAPIGEGSSHAGARICVPVDTGSPLPQWADAVVRIEDTRRTQAGYEVRGAVVPGRDVRRVGEDIEAGALVASRGRTLGPHDLGALLATGVSHVDVRRPPRISVLATGSEVVEPPAEDAVLAPGQVIEYNSRMLGAYAREWGAQAVYLGRAGDDAGELAQRVRGAVVASDAMCIIAGSSAGRKDTSVAALERCGEILFRGVEVMPGKPAAFAVVDGKPVFVIPGYPVSAVVVYRELVRPWVDAALGRAQARAPTVRAAVRRKIASRLGLEELVRVCLAFEGDGFVVAPLPRGAGSISTLVRAHGLLRIGPRVEGFDAGADVDVELLEPDVDLRRCVVVAGPPDAVSADLEDVIAREGEPLRLSHLGLAPHDALAALAAGEAHMAVLSEGGAAGEGELPRGVRALRVGASQVLVSAALLATTAGTRVSAALSNSD